MTGILFLVRQYFIRDRRRHLSCRGIGHAFHHFNPHASSLRLPAAYIDARNIFIG